VKTSKSAGNIDPSAFSSFIALVPIGLGDPVFILKPYGPENLWNPLSGTTPPEV
jgi:hypothetical protein